MKMEVAVITCSLLPIALASIGHLDVAPPGALIALSAGALIALGLVVGGVVVVSILVIWIIKKRRPPSDKA